MTTSNIHRPGAARPLTMPRKRAGKYHEDIHLHHTSHTSLSRPHTFFLEWFTDLIDGPGQEAPWPCLLPSYPVHSESCPFLLLLRTGPCPCWHLVQATILSPSVLAPCISPTYVPAFQQPETLLNVALSTRLWLHCPWSPPPSPCI